MAAVILAPTPRPNAPRPGRPDLRVIHGGRARRRGTRPLPAAVYRRRRVVVATLLAAVLVGVLALASLGLNAIGTGTSAGPASAPAPAAGPVADSYVVQPGDTLWTIARTIQPSGDVRPLVDRLADRAGGAGIQAGQRIDLDGLVE